MCLLICRLSFSSHAQSKSMKITDKMSQSMLSSFELIDLDVVVGQMFSDDVGNYFPVASTEAAANVVRQPDFIGKASLLKLVCGLCKLGETTVKCFIVSVLPIGSKSILAEDVGDDDPFTIKSFSGVEIVTDELHRIGVLT